MRFLIDANLPRSLAARIRARGHEVQDSRDLGLATADDETIGNVAIRDCCVLVSRDFDFADVRNYPPSKFPGIVVVNFPSETSAEVLVAMIDAALAEPSLLNRLEGNLAIMEPGRVRVRIS